MLIVFSRIILADLGHADGEDFMAFMPNWPDSYGLLEDLTTPEDLHWSILTDIDLNIDEASPSAPNAHDERR